MDQTITYGYDAGTNQKGQLTSATDANHSLAWNYDTQGRITGKGQTVGAVTLAMGYGYNAAGQLQSTVLPSGSTISYGYNTNGQVSSLTLNGSTTILSGITYDPFGPITSWTWGNGSSANRAFDTDGKFTQVDNASGTSLKNYDYDDAFRISGITDAGSSAMTWAYGYDALDRLASATKTGTTQGWTYDANGNRLTQTGTTPSTYTNSTTSNRVASIAGSLSRTYLYDAAGNTLSYGGITFTYNNRGRMATATNGGVTVAYTYNALGQRIKRTVSGVTTLFVYDEAGHLAGEYTAAGAIIEETVWLGDKPVATLRPNGSGGVILYYVHTDHLNTPRLVTDTSNNIRWRWDSDPFGVAAPNENPSGLGAFTYNLRFPGQQYDSLTGLHYNYFRDFDPSIGKYLQSDPIGLAGGTNTYAYVWNAPSMGVDPLGLDVFRSPNGYFGDIPGPGGCERAIFAGDALMGWEPCPEPERVNDYSIGYSQVPQPDPGCPPELAASGFQLSPWDLLFLLPQGRIIEGTGALYKGMGSFLALRKVVGPVSRIKESTKLIRGAETAGRSAQESIDRLTQQLARGNLNPGIGTRPIGSGIFEARARDGARVYFRQTADGTIEILGKSTKANQQPVIDEVLRVFGN